MATRLPNGSQQPNHSGRASSPSLMRSWCLQTSFTTVNSSIYDSKATLQNNLKGDLDIMIYSDIHVQWYWSIENIGMYWLGGKWCYHPDQDRLKLRISLTHVSLLDFSILCLIVTMVLLIKFNSSYTCMLCLLASGIQNVWLMDRPQAHLVALTQLWDWGEKRFFKIVSWYDNECLALNLNILLCGTNPRCFDHDGIFNLMSKYDWLKFLSVDFSHHAEVGLQQQGCRLADVHDCGLRIFHSRLVLEHGKINGMLWPVRIITWKRLFSRLITTFCAPQDHSRPQSKRVPAAV